MTLEDGTKIRVVCGNVGNRQGPVRDIVIDPEYLDVTIPAGSEFIQPTKRGHTVLSYVIDGKVTSARRRNLFLTIWKVPTTLI